jgi:hypothetical protein
VRAAVATAWGGPGQASAVLAAKEETLALLERRRGSLPAEDYHGWYGQILDVEDTMALRKLWRAIITASEGGTAS